MRIARNEKVLLDAFQPEISVNFRPQPNPRARNPRPGIRPRLGYDSHFIPDDLLMPVLTCISDMVENS